MSRRLAERAGRVVAVEPDARMLAVLHRRSPAAGAVVGAAEHLPLASGQFDVVVVSSAWHWMEPAAASMEIARVLRPGGVFGVLWSGADRSVDWVGEVLAAPAGTPVRHHRRTVDLPPGAPFERPELASLQWTLPRTGPELLGLAGTYSSVLIRTRRSSARRVPGWRAPSTRSCKGPTTGSASSRCAPGAGGRCVRRRGARTHPGRRTPRCYCSPRCCTCTPPGEPMSWPAPSPTSWRTPRATR